MMKTLTLFRHGKAGEKIAMSDFDRPLTRRGQSDVAQVTAWLRKRSTVPDLILSSPAIRAAETARIVAGGFGLDETRIAWDADLYLAPPSVLLGAVRQLPPTVGHVILVGHNPGMLEFANVLRPGALRSLPTAGTASFALEIPAWPALAPQPVLRAAPLIGDRQTPAW